MPTARRLCTVSLKSCASLAHGAYALAMDELRFKPIFPGDWADADRAYHNYVENCHRLGIQPMAWDEARVLMGEWSAKLAAGRPPSSNLQ